MHVVIQKNMEKRTTRYRYAIYNIKIIHKTRQHLDVCLHICAYLADSIRHHSLISQLKYGKPKKQCNENLNGLITIGKLSKNPLCNSGESVKREYNGY